jgi:hypothetical protein
MDMASIGAAISGLKFAKDALQTTMRLSRDAEVNSQIVGVLEKLNAAHESLFDVRDDAFRLQEENATLKRHIQSHDDWKARASQYTLQRASGGALAYQYAGLPSHWACPVCFEKQTVGLLQDGKTNLGLYECSDCKRHYHIAVGGRIPQSYARRSVE